MKQVPTIQASQLAERASPEPQALDETVEHIYLADDSDVGVAAEPKTVAESFELRDRLRRVVTEITLYQEGFLRVEETRGGKRLYAHRLDLRYLDPMPTLKSYYPKRWLKIAAACGATGALAGLLASFAALRAFLLPAAVLAGLAALATLLVFVYFSHEKIVFRTRHGRAAALKLIAGLGCMRRFRAALPALVHAIQEAEEELDEDTAIFLRAEMREHYRLRGEGVLSERECGDGTGRILTHFDDEV
jgi:hypothetical protein